MRKLALSSWVASGLVLATFALDASSATAKPEHAVHPGAHIMHRGLFTEKKLVLSPGRAGLRSASGHISPYAASRAGVVNTADGLSIRSYFRRAKPNVNLGVTAPPADPGPQ